MKTLQEKKNGRPTKYIPDIIYPKIEEYLLTCGREQTTLPTFEGLADYLDVESDTIRNWSKKYKRFFGAIRKIVDKQKVQLMNDGMYGGKEINACMAIFLLKVNHGMNEIPPPPVQVNLINNITDDQLIRVIEKRSERDSQAIDLTGGE